ncbi:MAG: hypothetical protein AUI50_04790 [Crenarchaeota archaeon 13_1_40CM_2_52_14]|nr:MAG: hypothetical protein AUI97_08820 [Crenarchaeota archaeon 13_1_40CM_3_52_17]OLD34832.1 MAG: hypothetical protein AUI50_04790 [Crenarchaeota archaeon 13_1_40CM_2_52_14]OLE70058.1 MAG: hypothetical protein AUF78_08220 [archaeon 13_1_20CM_2_51_12]
MKEILRVAFYRTLAILGLILVVFLQLPVPLATLSLIEPILIATLLVAWFTSYYLRATVAKRVGAGALTPVFRGYLLGHLGIADGLKFLVLALSLVFVWAVWSSQPVRIFNATLLGTVWAGVEVTNSLVRYRRRSV